MKIVGYEICPRCGAKIRDADVCPKCGEKLLNQPVLIIGYAR